MRLCSCEIACCRARVRRRASSTACRWDSDNGAPRQAAITYMLVTAVEI